MAMIKIKRCKECDLRGTDDCPMYFVEEYEYNDDGWLDHDWIVHDRTLDDGFCDRGIDSNIVI